MLGFGNFFFQYNLQFVLSRDKHYTALSAEVEKLICLLSFEAGSH